MLLAVGAVLLGLLWLIELTDDPTDGVAFYMLLFGAPLPVGVALVLVAAQEKLATRSGNCASSAVTSRAAVSPVESEMTCSSTGGAALIGGTSVAGYTSMRRTATASAVAPRARTGTNRTMPSPLSRRTATPTTPTISNARPGRRPWPSSRSPA